MRGTTERTDGWAADTFGVRLYTDDSPIGWELADLVGLALRRNPRRAHLLVSSWLGKHVPADPDLIRGSGQLLGLLVAVALGEPVPGLRPAADALRQGDPRAVAALTAGLRPAVTTTVFGFAETATGLGHCVAEALNPTLCLHSTRREIGGVPVALRFQEGHSHATDHLLQPFPAAILTGDDVLVLVDDELSTGSTAMAAITAVQQVAPRRRYVVAALVDLRSAADTAALDAFADRHGLHVTVVSLASGRVVLPPGLAAEAATHIAERPIPERGAASTPSTTRVDLPWPVDVPEGGRHGLLATEADAFDAAVAVAARELAAALPAAARRVLVVGTEEFMYLPLRLAAGLADAERLIRFQTTTRSPVHPESHPTYPVRRAFRFASPEGDTTAPRYLYNADWDGGEPDVTVVVLDAAADTPALQADDGLLAALAAAGAPLVVAVIPGAAPVALGARG